MAVVEPTPRSRLYIAGGPGGSSIGPPVHDFVANQLQKPWSMAFVQSPTIEDVVKLFRTPDFAGGVITMPWKKSIIPFLDETDDLVSLLGACNVVTTTPAGWLRGTNIDWVGIKIPLLLARPANADGGGATCGMIYGAGGASRAALYALAVEIRLSTILIINRDDAEVADFMADTLRYKERFNLDIIHVKTAEQAKSLPVPSYVVSTVPDFEAKTSGEIAAQEVLRQFLSRGKGSDGVMLDMCYHPRLTRNIRLAREFGWTTLDGVQAVASQFKVQWELWTGKKMPRETELTAFDMLEQIALADSTVGPK